MFDEPGLAEILDVLYEAPVDPSRWQDFLRLTAQIVRGEAAALLQHDFTNSQSFVARQWNIDPEAHRLYEAHYSSKDVWLEKLRKVRDWLGTSEQFIDFSSLQKTEFYNEFLLPAGIPHAILGMVEHTPSRLANISIYRGLRVGPFEHQDLEPIRFLTPHIKRAYQFHGKLAAARSENASLHAALNSLAIGVILVAQDARVITMNRVAERLVAENDGLSATHQGLRAKRMEESTNLEKLIAEASLTSAGKGLNAGGAMNISRVNRAALHVLVSPVRGLELEGGQFVRAVVFVTDPTEQIRPTPETLRILFGLTPAECRLASLLADGRSPTEIAEMLAVSKNTLKSQLASIFSKTGTSRQAELVRLLLQISASRG